jgi:thymidylate synthase (FAD)
MSLATEPVELLRWHVDSCDDCPFAHAASIDRRGVEHACIAHRPARGLGRHRPNYVPTWCPLHTADIAVIRGDRKGVTALAKLRAAADAPAAIIPTAEPKKEPKMKATLVDEPTIFVLGETQLDDRGLVELVDWLKEFAPECLDPEDGSAFNRIYPHVAFEGDRALSGGELLVELAGRKCYNSFGRKAGRKSNAEYIANLFGEPGKIPHASVLYHAKMTFFFGGVGRRLSHELIRHYVGADRSEEGSPSQESTRFTHHSGHFSVHPRDADDVEARTRFHQDMNTAYENYLAYIDREVTRYREANGKDPVGMDRKRIYEAAAQRLPGAACTSFVWTTNPMALAKLFAERCDYAADLEMQRFAIKLRTLCYARWPNLFAAANPACTGAK